MAEDRPVKVEAARRGGEELTEDTYTPLVDIHETDCELVIVAEVPGAGRDDITVQVDKGVLTLQADSTPEAPGEQYAQTYVSFQPGQYFRAFALSDEIDRERISATCSDGVLTVRLPKAKTAKSRKIEIKTGD